MYKYSYTRNSRQIGVKMSSKGFKPPRRPSKKYVLGDLVKETQDRLLEERRKRYEKNHIAFERLKKGEITFEEYSKISRAIFKTDSLPQPETSMGGLRSRLDSLIIDALEAAMVYQAKHKSEFEKDDLYKGLKIRHLRYLLGSIEEPERINGRGDWLRKVRAEIAEIGHPYTSRLIICRETGKKYSSQYIWNRCSRLCHIGILDYEDGRYRFGPRYYYRGGLNVFKEKTRGIKWSDSWTDHTVLISNISTLQQLGIDEKYMEDVVIKLEAIALDFHKRINDGIESRMASEVDKDDIKEIYSHPLFIIDPLMTDWTIMEKEDQILASDWFPYHSHSSMTRILPKESIKRETRIEKSRKASR